MERTEHYEYGREFRVNDNGPFYPAYMPLEALQKLAFNFAHKLLGAIVYAEVKVAQIDDGKGLAWEIITFSEEPGEKEIVWVSRKYTFNLHPSWRVSGFHDHWLSGLTPRCEYLEKMDDKLHEIVINLLAELKEEYQKNWYHPQLDRYLRNRNWTNILTLGRRSFNEQSVKKDRRAEDVRNEAKRNRDMNKKKTTSFSN